jgi:hypothetical protein
MGMQRRVGDYWQAWCPGNGCGQLLGTFKPTKEGKVVVCPRCGTEAVIELSPFGFPICYDPLRVQP